MKSSQILLPLLSILPLLIFDAARAQTVSKVSVAAKGAFEFEKSYPKAADGKTPFNLLTGFIKPKSGQKINYFVFRNKRRNDQISKIDFDEHVLCGR
ncbi:hypothetical protein [Mesorhizobium sp. M0814]|uniref:hypothetical protein n=1 Tax=unclassified Mesorhizobium TaxID=325217 RepID=UPI003339325E